jgi:hypothetical protein
MEVITIESQAFKLLLGKIENIQAEITRKHNPVDQFAMPLLYKFDSYYFIKIENCGYLYSSVFIEGYAIKLK